MATPLPGVFCAVGGKADKANWQMSFGEAFPNQTYTPTSFQRMIGFTENTVDWAWDLLNRRCPLQTPKHMLWTLYFARHYPTRFEATAITSPGKVLEHGGKAFERVCKRTAFDLRVALPSVCLLL